MTLHIAKLSVGSTSADDLAMWQRSLTRGRNGARHPYHVTRMFPRRADEVLESEGSLYWVIGGYFTVRQRILGFDPVTAGDGTRKCRITLYPDLIPVVPVPRGAFQGWRYLKTEDTPADSTTASGDGQMLERTLSELGLL